jgi:hypothetical protein
MAVRYYKDEATIYTRALQLYIFLTFRAKENRLVSYSECCKHMGYKGAGVLGGTLATIAWWCKDNDLPAITSIVVNHEDGKPGPGFTFAKDIPSEQWKVFTKNWHEFMPPSLKDLRASREAHMADA